MINSKDIFLTFDMDWASDDVLKWFYDFMEELDVPYEINVTHNTELLNIFRDNDLVELGIHPNFNPLLTGTRNECHDFKEVLCNIKNIVPEAVTMRSHSLTDSSQIKSELKNIGIKNNLNVLIPPFDGMVIKAQKNWNGINIIPFIFEDDVYILTKCNQSIEYFLSDRFDAPRVFNMHPIHVFLNTNTMSVYENARPHFGDYNNLKKCINSSCRGTRNILIDIVNKAKLQGFVFRKIKDGNWNESCNFR